MENIQILSLGHSPLDYTHSPPSQSSPCSVALHSLQAAGVAGSLYLPPAFPSVPVPPSLSPPWRLPWPATGLTPLEAGAGLAPVHCAAAPSDHALGQQSWTSAT